MGLERLNILFFFVNATVMLPDRIVVEKTTVLFKRFKQRWKQPRAWCFALMTICLLIWTVIQSILQTKYLINSHKANIIYLFVMILWQTANHSVKLSPLLLVFQIKKLKLAFKYLVKVDQELEKITTKPCSSRSRIIIGYGLAIIGNVAISITALSLFEKLRNSLGLTAFVIIIFTELISRIQLATWFLLFHLIHYNIAHRIQILTSLLTDQVTVYPGSKVTVAPLNFRKMEHAELLQKIGYLFDQLAKASHELQSVFSFPVLLVLMSAFLSFTIGTFIFINELIFSHSLYQSQNSLYFQFILVIVQVAIVLTIILSADLPVEEVKRLNTQVTKLSIKPLDIEWAALLMSLREDRFRLSASGLFIVRKELIPSLVGTVITYLVILLQNLIENKNNDDKRPFLGIPNAEMT